MRNKTLSGLICVFIVVGLFAPFFVSSSDYILADQGRDEIGLAADYSYIWHDDCSNTTGWTNHTEWGGYTEWSTASGTLASDGDAIHCPENSGWDSGPFWFKEFPTKLSREEFAMWDFQVNVSQPSVSYKGDIMACLYDDEKLPVFAIHFHSWDDLDDELYINLHYCNENGTSERLYSRPSVSIPDFNGVCSIYYESGTGLVAQIGTEGSGVLMTEEEWNLELARNISYIGIQWRRGSGNYLDYFVHEITVAQGYEPSIPVTTWHDDCSNTTGWTYHTEWDGYTRWGTASGTMTSDGDAIHCPTNSGWETGPFWFKEFPGRFRTENFSRWDFQVYVNQPADIYKGGLCAALFDDEKQPVLMIQLLSWDDLDSDLYIYLIYRYANGTWVSYQRPNISIPNFNGTCSIYHEAGIGLVARIGEEGDGVILDEESWILEPARNISYIGIQWRRGSGTYLDYFVHDILVEGQMYEDSSPEVIGADYTWHDDCSNTTGWTYHTEWDGPTEWATASGTLASDGDAIHCPENSGWETGPFWFKEFPDGFTTEKFSRWDFQVSVSQPSVSYKGDIMAWIFDDQKQPIMAVHFHSWDDLDSDLYINLHYVCDNGTTSTFGRPNILIPNFDGVCSIYYLPGFGLVAQIGTEGSGILMSEESWNLEPSRHISYIGIQWRRGSGIYLDYYVHDILLRQGSWPSDPVIDSPADITYEFGTTGHNITWTPISASPDYFEVYRNLEVGVSETWNGSQVVVDIDGLSVGVYIYSIFVFNDAGSLAFDWVIVTVIEASTPDTTTTPTQTSPIDIMLVSISIGSAAVIIIVAGLMCRSRGAENAISTGQSGYNW